jgi:hypothetical protein
MYLSNSQFGQHSENNEKKTHKAVDSKKQRKINAHHVLNLDDQLKFAKLMQNLSTPTNPLNKH